MRETTIQQLHEAMEKLPFLLDQEAIAKHEAAQGEIVLDAAEAEFAIEQRARLGKCTETQLKELILNDHKLYSLRLAQIERQLVYDRAKNKVKVCWKTIEILQQVLVTPQ